MPILTITDTIGNTPLIALQRIGSDLPGRVLVKVEYFNPLSSVKDRIGIAMIKAAQARGELHPGSVLIEPTSGNTGIALAFIAAVQGYRLILTMPESMSLERQKLLTHLGAELILTPRKKGMSGAVEHAQELAQKLKNALILQQFENPANPLAHQQTTGPEIWTDTNGKVDFFVAGVGTGGTITGTSRFLKRKQKNLRAIAVEPKRSPILSGGKPGPHSIQGIGADFIPKNLDQSLLDEVITVDDEAAFKMSRRLAKQEGILAGISSGANVVAALKIAARPENKNKTIVTIIASCGERYLSTPLFSNSFNP